MLSQNLSNILEVVFNILIGTFVCLLSMYAVGLHLIPSFIIGLAAMIIVPIAFVYFVRLFFKCLLAISVIAVHIFRYTDNLFGSNQ